jgi:hypothetical protein
MFRRIGISVEQYSYLQTKIHQFPLLSNSLQIGITYFSKWIEQNLEKREKLPLTLSVDQLINGSGNEVFKYRFARILSHFLFNDNGQNINGPTAISNFDLLKLFLRFGKDTPFDFLIQFIRTDSENELICSDGFSIFENTFSAAQRLKQSKSQWIIIPDSTEFGFYLFVQNIQNIRSYHIFLLRSIDIDLKNQTSDYKCSFYLEENARTVYLGETWKDVLALLELNENLGLPSEQLVTVIKGTIPNSSSFLDIFNSFSENDFFSQINDFE